MDCEGLKEIGRDLSAGFEIWLWFSWVDVVDSVGGVGLRG